MVETTGEGIPGLENVHLNAMVATLKCPTWTTLLSLLGRGGEKTMLHLLLDCGVFLPTAAGQGSFIQLSGGLGHLL